MAREREPSVTPSATTGQEEDIEEVEVAAGFLIAAPADALNIEGVRKGQRIHSRRRASITRCVSSRLSTST